VSPVRRFLPGRVRRFYVGHRSTIGYVLLVAYVTAVGGFAYQKLEDNDSQFCEVAAQRLVDKETQIGQSVEYLASPAGMEQTGLNTFIRESSLPRLRGEVESDRGTLPGSCRDEYDRLKS
jgi:hypothetical protein